MGGAASIIPSVIGSVVGRAISGVTGIGKRKEKLQSQKN